MKMKIRVIIPSYNREESLKRLIAQIKEYTPEYYEVSIQVWVDGCEYNNLQGVEVRKMSHHGKRLHWKLCDIIFKNQIGLDCKYFFWLPDDAVLTPNFFMDAITQWKAIKDVEKACLNLLMDEGRRGKANWTGFVPRLERHGGHRVYLSNWVDMCFMFQFPLLEALNYKINPINKNRWNENEKLSSGVGQQISQRLFKKRFKMFQVNETLVNTGHLESVMHPWRKKVWKP